MYECPAKHSFNSLPSPYPSQTSIADNILVLSSRGSGKSVLARYLVKALSQKGELCFASQNPQDKTSNLNCKNS